MRATVDAVEPLLAELAQRASAEAEARLSAARAEADRIREAGAALRQARREEALAHSEAEAWRCGQPELARATREARQRVLGARRALVDRVLAGALSLMRARAERSAPPVEWLRLRVAEVLSFTGGSEVELQCPAGWVAALGAVVVGRPNVRVVPAPEAATGLRALDPESRLTVDDTADGWLRRERAALAIDICRAAEEGG